MVSFTDTMVGRLDSALSWSRLQVANAEALGLDEVRGLALTQRGTVLCEMDDPRGVDDLIAAVGTMTAADSCGELTGLGAYELPITFNNLAERRWLVQGVDAALADFAEGLRIAEGRGARRVSLEMKAERAKVLFDAGRWDELLADKGTVGDTGLAVDDYPRVVVDAEHAKVLVWRGDRAAAAAILEATMPAARKIGDAQVLGPALEAQAAVHLAAGRSIDAVDTVAEFAETVGRSPSTRARHLATMVRVAIAAEDLPLAERLVEGTDLRIRRHVCAHLTALDALAEVRGNHRVALDQYAQAARTWQEHGVVLEHGHAIFGLARCAGCLGDGRASPALHDARSVFAGLAAQPMVHEVDSWVPTRAV